MHSGRDRPIWCVADLRLPDGLGLELLAETTPASDLEFIVVTGNAQRGHRGPRDAQRRDRLSHRSRSTLARLTGALANVARMRGLKRELSACARSCAGSAGSASWSARRRRCRRSTT